MLKGETLEWLLSCWFGVGNISINTQRLDIDINKVGVCVCVCVPMIRELCQKLLKDRGKLWFSCQVIQVTFVPLRLPSIC